MRTLYLTTLAGAALCGCASDMERVSLTMDNGLASMVGQPVETAVAVFGDPIGTAQLDSDTVYGWGSSEMGTVSGTFFGYDGRPNSSPAASTLRRDVEWRCEVHLLVDPQGTIRGWNYSGNLGGCRPYAEMLE